MAIQTNFENICSQVPRIPNYATKRNIKRKPYEWEDTAFGSRVMWVPLKNIFPAPCQRETKQYRVQKIAENWVPQMYRGAVGYMERKNAFVVDAAHSTAAMKEIFSEDTLIPVTLITKSCASEMFSALNTQITKVANNDQYFSHLSWRREDAIYIHDVMESYGVTLVNLKTIKSDYTCGCPGALLEWYQRYGEEIWTDCIDKLMYCYDGELSSLYRTFMEGFFQFYIARSNERPRPSWSRVRRKTAGYVLAKAKTLGKSSGSIYTGVGVVLDQLDRVRK